MKIVDMVDSQVIATVKQGSDIDAAINSNANIVFLLTGNLLNVKEYIAKLKQGQKKVFLHLDFIDGLRYRKSSIEFIAKKWEPDGIIDRKSTRLNSSHVAISYAVFCLKKKKKIMRMIHTDRAEMT